MALSEHQQLCAKLDALAERLDRIAGLLEPRAAVRRITSADVLSLQQTAKALRRRYVDVRALVQDGVIAGRCDEHGRWFIPRTEVERYVAARLEGAA